MRPLYPFNIDETATLLSACLAYENGDIEMEPAIKSVRDYLLWEHRRTDDSDLNPHSKNVAQEWAEAQKTILDLRNTIGQLLPEDAESAWRFEEWAPTFTFDWSNDLVMAVNEAIEFLIEDNDGE